jgi:hypothetical protein
VKDPDGTTTISGHFSHSLNTSFGVTPHSSAADNGWAERDDRETVTGALPQGPDETTGADGATGGERTAT